MNLHFFLHVLGRLGAVWKFQNLNCAISHYLTIFFENNIEINAYQQLESPYYTVTTLNYIMEYLKY